MIVSITPKAQARAYRLGFSIARSIQNRGYHRTGAQTIEKKALPISGNSLNKETNYNICFLRHGQSTWNRENIFIGWTGKYCYENVRANLHGISLMTQYLIFLRVSM